MKWLSGDDCIADLFTKSADAPKFRKFTRFILGEATQEHKTALVSRAYCTYRVSDITQAKQVPFALGVCVWEGGQGQRPCLCAQGKRAGECCAHI